MPCRDYRDECYSGSRRDNSRTISTLQNEVAAAKLEVDQLTRLLCLSTRLHRASWESYDAEYGVEGDTYFASIVANDASPSEVTDAALGKSLVKWIEKHEAEDAARKVNVITAALAKLTNEEKQYLGLTDY